MQAHCNHAFSIHESQHSPPSSKKKFVDTNLNYKIIKIIKKIAKLFVRKKNRGPF